MSLVNKPAPAFSAPAFVDGEIRTVAFRDLIADDHWLVLFFYPKDFTFVCPTELVAFGEQRDEFKALSTRLAGVSTDTAECHRGWAESDKRLGALGYPLIGDHKKEIARGFDVLDEDEGVALRGTFIIDPTGKVRWMQVNDLDTGRELGEVLRVLAALQTGGLTACAWRPGQPNLVAE